jgi:hypothetical protein
MNLSSVPLSAPSSDLPIPTLLNFTDTKGTFALRLDNSSTEHITTCPAQALQTLVLGRTSAHEKAALTYGSAIHAALEVLYTWDYWTTENRNKFEILSLANNAIFTEFASFSSPFADEWRSADRAVDTIRRYLLEYESEPLTPLANLVEIPFSIPLGVIEFDGTPQCPSEYEEEIFFDRVFGEGTGPQHIDMVEVFWTGKIDMIAKDGGETFIVDHKTSSITGPSYFKDFELSQQTIGYQWAAEQLLDQKLAGFVLNLIIGRKLTKTGTGTDFDRRKYYYPRHRLEEWPENTLTVISEFLSYLRHGLFPKHTKWCVGKYGVCPQHDVCMAKPGHRQMILFSGQFKDNTWTPLKK